MAKKYKVRMKSGDYEIEIESNDKNYVNSKLKEFLSEKSSPSTKSIPTKTHKGRKVNIKESKEALAETKLDIVGLVAHIKDSDKYSQAEDNIIDKKDELPKIMMCMYFKNEFSDDPYLTTGQVEKITDQLGIKLKMSNVASKIRNNQAYFTAKTVRQKGKPVPYKLNRRGEKAFEKYLKGETS